MRNVVFAMNISIDGCYDHTRFGPDAELMDYFIRFMLDTGLIVYGRKTYELMIPYWPDVAKNEVDTPQDIAFAKAMVPVPKIVFSRTLKNAEGNTEVVNDDPEKVIRKLKQQSGKKIALSSTSLLPQMLKLGLIDELYLMVHPVLVGDDKRLFENFHSPENHNLKLTTSRTFQSGVVALHYQKHD